MNCFRSWKLPIICTGCFLAISISAGYAQGFWRVREWNWIHFGIALGVNFHQFHIRPSPQLYYNDSILAVETGAPPGFHIGIISDVRLFPYVHLRFIPTVALSDHLLLFEKITGEIQREKIQSTYAWFPLTLAIRSENIQNQLRWMVEAGFMPYWDLLSEARDRLATSQIRLYPFDVAVVVGISMEILFEYFTLGIRIHWYRGTRNLFVPLQENIYQRVLEGLWNNALVLSIHFE